MNFASLYLVQLTTNVYTSKYLQMDEHDYKSILVITFSQFFPDAWAIKLIAMWFFVINSKTKHFRASKMSCVPIKLMIAVILHPLLRYLRPS